MEKVIRPLTSADLQQMREIGKRLKELRGGSNQRDFAGRTGGVQQTISKYERGEIPRSWLFLARLAEANIDITELLTGKTAQEIGREYEIDFGPRFTGQETE